MKDRAAELRLKTYIDENFDIKLLKKIGFFSKDIKATDYEKIAARLCEWFGLKSIYAYSHIMKKQTDWKPFSVDVAELHGNEKHLN